MVETEDITRKNNRSTLVSSTLLLAGLVRNLDLPTNATRTLRTTGRDLLRPREISLGVGPNVCARWSGEAADHRSHRSIRNAGAPVVRVVIVLAEDAKIEVSMRWHVSTTSVRAQSCVFQRAVGMKPFERTEQVLGLAALPALYARLCR